MTAPRPGDMTATQIAAANRRERAASGDGPIFRLDESSRRSAVRAYVGHLVEIEFDVHRDGSLVNTLAGRLIALASTYGPGPQSETLVLDTDGRTLGLTIARIRSIRRIAVVPDPGLPDPTQVDQ